MTSSAGSGEVSTMRLLDIFVDKDGAEKHVGQEAPNLLPGELHLGRLLSLQTGNCSCGEQQVRNEGN